MTVESILSAYMKEYPFEKGKDGPERDRYYWLSGFLRSIKAGEDDEMIAEKYLDKIDRETGEFLKKQIGK